ncbi:MAG: hypothetical protein Q9220_004537 [cf. Caloplaca sp. 1 TL-2023]
MSLLWFNDTSSAQAKHAGSENVHSTNATGLLSILAAVGLHLPILQPANLTYDAHLGKGSSFEVSRQLVDLSTAKDWEPYYVAVKRIIVYEGSQEHIKRQWDSVIRELRVLTHPGLRYNTSILPLLAYGWTSDLSGFRPYLIMQYSNHGTLVDYLHRTKAGLDEKYEFVVDVALGLKAIHESKIVHGDIKPRNVLVFESAVQQRLQVAKIADFGSSIFELDHLDTAAYSGSALYKGQDSRKAPNPTCALLYQFDIYAFGITAWEIFKDGASYIEESWLVRGESKKEFLQRIGLDEGPNAIQKRAQDFISYLATESGLFAICGAIGEVMSMTLIDDGGKRAYMHRIVELLNALSKGEREPPSLPRILPSVRYSTAEVPMLAVHTPPKQSPMPSSLGHSSKQFTGYKLRINPSSNPNFRFEGPSINDAEQKSRLAEAENRITVLARPKPTALTQYKPARLNIFQMSMSMNPPWNVQVEAFRSLSHQILSKTLEDQPAVFDAHLQLALCYHVGYGIQPDLKNMFHHLTLSLKGNDIARAIYRRVVVALAPDASDYNIDLGFRTQLDLIVESHTAQRTYFAHRVILYQRTSLADHSIQMSQVWQQGPQKTSDDTLSLTDLITTGDVARLINSLENHPYTERELSSGLVVACQQSKANAVMELLRYCKTYVTDSETPTPLHWLIMFEPEDAKKVLKALVSGDALHPLGLCNHLLDSAPAAGDGVFYLPDHCLELFGTPLHWATRTRNTQLVRDLCNFGADINARWRPDPPIYGDITKPTLPPLSALDIAVQYHLSDVVETLLDLGAQWLSSSLEESHSPLHCIGQTCVPFSRYILHGAEYEVALKETLRIITTYGHDVNETDPNGYNALMIALRDHDCETYVVRCLLEAGARADLTSTDDGSNTAVIVAANSLHRRFNAERFAMVAGCSPDINQLDGRGFNALHYAAITGSTPILAIIADLHATDLDYKSSRGDTALHYAATFGSAEVLSLLIKKGACIETFNINDKTALQLAILNRRREATQILLDARAEISFKSSGCSLGGNVLHAAVAGIRREDTMARELLSNHAMLCSDSILNGTNSEGWTPLHRAAHFGDYDAVGALLQHGALPNPRTQGSFGKTPLDLALRVLEEANSGNLGPDHVRISKQSPYIQNKFIITMKEIRRMLTGHEG